MPCSDRGVLTSSGKTDRRINASSTACNSRRWNHIAFFRHRLLRVPAPSCAQMEREVRFALVLYGGVSLAVYMNGVTQEFLHLVRSTAADAPAGGIEAVYKELAAIANARFVVDIASGSSAGAINAIF